VFPFFASPDGAAKLSLELTGGGLLPVSGPPNPSVSPQMSLSPQFGEPRIDEAAHMRRLAREHDELGRLLRGPSGVQSNLAPAPAAAKALAVPAAGDLLTLNTTTTCNSLDREIGRVEAVSRTAIIVADTSNPAGGFTSADYQAFAAAFDTLVVPVNTRFFGGTTDIDQNDRVIIFFTRSVNELTPPGSNSFTAGFFFAGDLFPRVDTPRLGGCPGSNTAELFYMLAPDPDGIVNSNRFSTDFVRRITVGVVGHEFQHLINASNRLYFTNATSFEEPWLNEGMSHIAEELLFYEVADLSPEQNIDIERIRSSEQIRNAFNTYAISNFGRLRLYMTEPELQSLLGVPNLETRGASWAFLRYAADVTGIDDAQFFRQLVRNPSTGVENLTSALGTDALDLMQSWTVSVYTDDAVPGVDRRFTQPSWNFRSIMPRLTETETFPLETIRLATAQERTLTLLGGGAAFLRFGVAGSGRALISTTSNGNVPGNRLRTSIVRTR
jgi:hypothetical protein